MSKRVQDICPNTKTSKEHSKFKKKYKKKNKCPTSFKTASKKRKLKAN